MTDVLVEGMLVVCCVRESDFNQTRLARVFFLFFFM